VLKKIEDGTLVPSDEVRAHVVVVGSAGEPAVVHIEAGRLRVGKDAVEKPSES